MKINIDCFKDILKYCINNIDYKEDGDSWNTICVDLTIMYEASELNYSKKDIMRTVLKLDECGFIKVLSKFPNNKPYLERCLIEDVTFRGYQFIESVKDPSIGGTKTIAGKVGNHTINFIENVAHDVAVETAKEAIAITMFKNS